MGDTKKYRNIDALRTFGCLAIIAWHIKANTGFSTGGVLDKVIPSFDYLVYLFMIISGFGMCQCYFMTGRFVTENFVMRHSFLYCLPYFLIGGIVYLYKDEIERFINQFKVISLCVVLALTVGYYITPDVINSINIVVIKTLILYTGWLSLALGYDNRLMNNKFTNYISNLSMEMYLSHMVVFRIVEKIGITERIESPIIRYMITYLLLVMLLVMGLTIYRKAMNKLGELR